MSAQIAEEVFSFFRKVEFHEANPQIKHYFYLEKKFHPEITNLICNVFLSNGLFKFFREPEKNQITFSCITVGNFDVP